MAAPPRGNTGYSIYFITASTFQRRPLFRNEPMARLFVEVLFHYRDKKKYIFHEFVVMPDHFRLLLSPTVSLERSLQLIKEASLTGQSGSWDIAGKFGNRAITTA